VSKPFKVEPFSNIDKFITINGPDTLIIAVDFDDVYHPQIRKDVKKLVKILNENWEKE
jgi:hypothetical protein